LALVFAAFNAGPFILVLVLVTAYFMAGFGDTATLAAGIVDTADPALRGATLAVYALAGFIGGMLGPVTFGIVLDVAGGRGDPAAWSWAFASLIFAAFVTAAALRFGRSAPR
ncbi:MAG: MFS transporter, partial [Pseudomonadota bacterium]